MEAENFYELLKQRDAHIGRLQEYATDLEEQLREKRGNEAHDQARDETEDDLRSLRYQHGLSVDLRIRD